MNSESGCGIGLSWRRLSPAPLHSTYTRLIFLRHSDKRERRPLSNWMIYWPVIVHFKRFFLHFVRFVCTLKCERPRCVYVCFTLSSIHWCRSPRGRLGVCEREVLWGDYFALTPRTLRAEWVISAERCNFSLFCNIRWFFPFGFIQPSDCHWMLYIEPRVAKCCVTICEIKSLAMKLCHNGKCIRFHFVQSRSSIFHW